MGTAVTGTVLVFGTPQHTATCTCDTAGTHGFIIVRISSVFLFQTMLFIIFYHFFSLCHTVTEPNMVRSVMHTSLLFTINLLPLTPTPIPPQKHCKLLF